MVVFHNGDESMKSISPETLQDRWMNEECEPGLVSPGALLGRGDLE